MSKQSRNADYYLKHKEARKAANDRARKRNYDYVNSLKDHVPCADCKIAYPYYVMDFDHVRGEKLRNVSDMCRAMFSMKALQEEIDKCEVVCSNCHRKRTHARKLATGV